MNGTVLLIYFLQKIQANQVNKAKTITEKYIDKTYGRENDIDGTKGVDKAFQGDAGRNYLMFGGMNPYNAGNEYGQGSVDTTNNVQGQYWVE